MVIKYTSNPLLVQQSTKYWEISGHSPFYCFCLDIFLWDVVANVKNKQNKSQESAQKLYTNHNNTAYLAFLISTHKIIAQ